MNMELISIVVAVYNAERTLKRCIDSLLSQTYQKTEIILVNDCSTDSSPDICKKYQEDNDNIVVISNLVNRGVSFTRNEGIRASNGRYICFVDSDDYVDPKYLEVLYGYCVRYNTLPICGFDFYDLIDEKTIKKHQWSEGNGIVTLDKIFKLSDEIHLGALWNKMFDNEIIKSNQIRFDEGLSMGEDTRFTLEYISRANLDKVYVTTETLYNYIRYSKNSLMDNFGLNGIEDAVENLNRLKKISEKFGGISEENFNYRIKQLKNNYIYFIVRSDKIKDKEKFKKIRQLKTDYSKLDFAKDKLLQFKEKVYKLLHG